MGHEGRGSYCLKVGKTVLEENEDGYKQCKCTSCHSTVHFLK